MKFKTTLCFILTFICTIYSFSRDKTRDSSSQLIQTIKVAFAQQNKNIDKIHILDIRLVKDGIIPTRGFLVLANGVRADLEFKGKFEDEQFALFLFDNSLLKIMKTFEFIRTPRWCDYDMWIENVTKDSVFIYGAGATYGDGAFQKGYKYFIK